jgi:hypothetical protein
VLGALSTRGRLRAGTDLVQAGWCAAVQPGAFPERATPDGSAVCFRLRSNVLARPHSFSASSARTRPSGPSGAVRLCWACIRIRLGGQRCCNSVEENERQSRWRHQARRRKHCAEVETIAWKRDGNRAVGLGSSALGEPLRSLELASRFPSSFPKRNSTGSRSSYSPLASALRAVPCSLRFTEP